MAGLADPPVGHPIRSPVQADPAASGARRCTASSFVLPHVTAATWRPSSRLDRNVRNPSGDGSEAMIAWGLTGVDEMALIFVRWRGAHRLPLGGGDFEAVAVGQKSENPISVNEGLSATPREGCISSLASAKC